MVERDLPANSMALLQQHWNKQTKSEAKLGYVDYLWFCVARNA